ncbi:alanine--tRNA ligase [Natranaerobius trueperi]|uniref:Alanine--tRNA ligase n=1 Tax=Natranaerobius trueperi TaxID=759412 RepID=A0A226BZA1_9FIRM|nr:alanine--tRNA ligase [Natranaerobius trueperi]OWZ83437.1 alanine--tRNA ligase [Natranaerobius trueperi]
MKTHEIRRKFLEFFEQKNHYVRKSYSVIPQNDPSLLLIGAGMAPLKPYFTGEKKPPAPRMATSQKCIRTPDIEEVGKTARHATFFEMLGNFSFGDYFKRDAILWAYEFCTEVLELEPKRVWGSVYFEDDEAYDIWTKEVGLPHERMVRLGKEDNFWEIGTGPCGPCSEIYYDRGEEYGCEDHDCKPGCECDRYLEMWNLVFTQFNLDEKGNYTTLEQKNIDTGAGLERLAVVMQDVPSIYEIDIIKPILDHICKLSRIEYGNDDESDVSLRIVTEHLRSVVVMIGDGVLPSNEGRGYVLRRILRRASRHGKLLGIKDTFMSEGANLVIDILKDAYSELDERRDYITKIIELEEERFNKTIDQGIGILQDYIENIKENNQNMLSGADAFKLYDTYGFPLELTKEILQEEGLSVDEKDFERALSEQREQARKAQKDSGDMLTESTAMKEFKDIEVEFVGYDNLEGKGEIKGIIDPQDDTVLHEAAEGKEVQLIVDSVPFYGESGGQVGDTGTIRVDNTKGRVKNTLINELNQTVLQVEVEKGIFKTGNYAELYVDIENRKDTMKNHSATHLLHHCLKQVLGGHVEQAGSLVTPDRLRFDFTHFESLNNSQLEKIEQQINQLIRNNYSVDVMCTDLNKAKEMGAIALFDEKYDEKVRIVKMGPTQELCGGTHVTTTGEIGLFKVINQVSIGAGVRRIEALTGRKALDYLSENEQTLKEIANILKTDSDKTVKKTKELVDDLKTKEKEIDKLKNQIFSFKVDELISQSKDVNGVSVINVKLDDFDNESLRDLSERVRDKLGKGVVVLGSSYNGKALFVAMVSKELVDQGIHAGNILKQVATTAGGGGGGRPDMAQAGGKKPEKLNDAIKQVEEIVKEQLNN